MQYTKPPTTIEEQINVLSERGMMISDKEKAAHYLRIIGYYRLSSYCYRFEIPSKNGVRTHKFPAGVTFEQVIRIYVFDQKLRQLMSEALERIEVAAKSIWSYEMSMRFGAHAYLEHSYFNLSEGKYRDQFEKLKKEIKDIREKANNIEILHYYEKYSEPKFPPIWLIISIMTFGEVSRWIMQTKSDSVKVKIAQAFGVSSPKAIGGVMRSLSVVRNLCAHHERVWDRQLITKLPLLKNFPMQTVTDSKGSKVADSRMYNYLLVLSKILESLNPDSQWKFRVAQLVKNSLTQTEQNIMGFPNNWESLDYWKESE